MDRRIGVVIAAVVVIVRVVRDMAAAAVVVVEVVVAVAVVAVVAVVGDIELKVASDRQMSTHMSAAIALSLAAVAAVAVAAVAVAAAVVGVVGVGDDAAVGSVESAAGAADQQLALSNATKAQDQSGKEPTGQLGAAQGRGLRQRAGCPPY